MTRSLLWFRRDLRLADNPALLAARDAADEVVGLFVLDRALWQPAGDVRRAYLLASLAALDTSMDGHLVVLRGDPVDVVPRAAREAGAGQVHVAADFGPYGCRRDTQVEQALGEADLVRTGSPYAVAPGRVTNGDGERYRVFTPFRRAWTEHGWRAPATNPRSIAWSDGGLIPVELPAAPDLGDLDLPAAGERAARDRWRRFRDSRLTGYHDDRDRPDLDHTSGMSVHLKYGEIHPRTMLADLGPGSDNTGQGAETYKTELAWREFYADVLFADPGSARASQKMKNLSWSTGQAADEHLEAWKAGRTGYPIVDAGMRQLAATGWMHNRVRMIVASFLVKDLHLDWRLGARHFMQALRDGDLASNNHGWQWVAGTGTDPQPFFRIFNPITQGTKFDPDGDYVRRWVPELAQARGKAVHQPWEHGGFDGYPDPIVDHGEERRLALDRLDEAKGS